jgi:hypothetical protein
MTTTTTIILIVVLVALAAGAYLTVRYRESKRLQSKFGPEYDRTVQEQGSRLKAENRLGKLEKRVKRYQIRPLLPDERDRFQQTWHVIQLQFVDDPNTAVNEADRLISRIMTARGYPVEDFDQCAADISVDHPQVVENYRVGHEIVVRHVKGQATTEDLRRAMLHYRTLFEDLIEVPMPAYAVAAAASRRSR